MNAHDELYLGGSPGRSRAFHQLRDALRALWALLAWPVSAYRAARRQRAELQHLLEMDDHLLKDIGVNRAEIRFRLGAPPSQL